MPNAAPDSLEALLGPLLVWDASGRTWLRELLGAAPDGPSRLGDLADAPGWLVSPLAVPTASGRLAAFSYTLPPPRELLKWFIAHPERLTWPLEVDQSRESELLRRALLEDRPAGARVRAQERARELLGAGALAAAWWRFEEPFPLDCALITDRLVVTIGAGDPVAPAGAWYPARTRLVRTLEAGAQLAAGRPTATLWLVEGDAGESPTEAELAAALAAGAPHLEPSAREALASGYLGAVGMEAARAAVAATIARARGSKRRGIT